VIHSPRVQRRTADIMGRVHHAGQQKVQTIASRQRAGRAHSDVLGGVCGGLPGQVHVTAGVMRRPGREAPD
jgi:hypothetical protein